MRMKPDLQQFFLACDPSRVLKQENAEDQKYYINFSEVRGAEIIKKLGRSICWKSEDYTCQLFTGHIGCGKSTELSRLKTKLEQEGFQVVYFESSQDLDKGDLDISDILLAIARRVSENLEAIKIKPQGGYFTQILQECVDVLNTPIDVKGVELSLGIGKITTKTKESPQLRSQLRQYLEPKTENLLKAINEELLEPAKKELQRRGQKGLVVIIDNLDRVNDLPHVSGKSLPEYLFVSRGEQLNSLHCHVVYTIPLILAFSNEREALKNRLGGGTDPMVLPMVPVSKRDGSDSEAGLQLLRQMVLARAFPDQLSEERLNLVTEVFDSPATLDRLCRVSGGHVRNLLSLLSSCLLELDTLPIDQNSLEIVIRKHANELALAITPDEWELLEKVAETKSVTGETQYQILLHSLFVFQYHNEQGDLWFDINPVLAEIHSFQ
ncbi:MAG: AAA family ATPase [Symploca sp. SIO1B1]|nr:AAA family ATPase [Symploca sp. SIO1C2]NES00226.1 AAA family ATPase [Symploca sp. SIO1B1]